MRRALTTDENVADGGKEDVLMEIMIETTQ